MPRRARIAVTGIPWHIVQRGNNRSACFYAQQDYRRYLDILTDMASLYECEVHAYVLMTNHVHLLLTPARKDSASLLMKHLGQRYVQYVNRHYGRSGTLWEGRFRSGLAQREEYVLTCYRYLYPGMKVIALSMHAEDRFVAAMRGAGAVGYVLKDKVAEELAAAIRAVAGGQTYFRLQAADDSE